MKLLALDFDGVIFDSAPECFVVALETFVEMHGDSRLAGTLERVRKAGDRVAAALPEEAHFREFVECMPLGNRAEDFGVALYCLENEIALPDQAAYDAVRDARPEEFLSGFHRRFYEIRTAFARERPQAWGSLVAPYTPFLAVLERRARETPLAIATAKDRASVTRLLGDYGIAGLFPDGAVLDKETGVHKRAHLALLRERFEVSYPELTFVDDKVNHLEAVADLGVRCALAGWGYNGEREQRRARELGFLVCDLDRAESQLWGE